MYVYKRNYKVRFGVVTSEDDCHDLCCGFVWIFRQDTDVLQKRSVFIIKAEGGDFFL
jgi:hypothetical protein